MYCEHFGLRELPFHVTPDPKFLYFAHQYREALDYLTFSLNQRKGFVLLTGEVGAGKTTLCRALLETLDRHWKTAILLNPSLSETQLLRAVLIEFGVTDTRGDKLALRDKLNTFLLGELRTGRDVLLIIDEAQHLGVKGLEQIRLLSNLETDQRKLLQIVLAGQPELRKTLADPAIKQLRQRIAVQYHLGPLAAEETASYVDHRLHVAGAGNTCVFAEDAVGNIHRHASGLPRLVNAISDMSMLAAYAEGKRCVTSDHVAVAVNELREVLA